MRIFWPRFSRPSLIRTRMTTPRYWSYQLSTSSAFSGALASPVGGGRRCTSASSTPSMFRPVLALISTASEASSPITSSICCFTRSGSAAGRSILFRIGHDFVVGLDRLVDVGQGLRLDPLAGIDDQQRPLARGEAAADLVGEVHVARRVHEVQFIGLTVLRLVRQADGLRLDGDASFPLQLHAVQDLVGHLTVGQRAGVLDQPVGQGGFPMVDVGDDREIADVVGRRVCHFSGISDRCSGVRR